MNLPRTIPMSTLRDGRGALSLLATPDAVLPFSAQRFFTLHDTQPEAQRGGHAHRAQSQLFVCLAGSVRVRARYGTVDGVAAMSVSWDLSPKEAKALYVPPLVWVDLCPSPDAVVLVLSSGAYDPDDYVRDFQELAKLSEYLS